MRYRATVSVTLALFALAACGGGEDGASSTPTEGMAGETATMTSEPTTPRPDETAVTSAAPTTTEAATSEPAQTATEEPDQSTGTETAEAAQFPDNPDEYVEAWVQAWAGGDTARAEELAATSPSLMVECLGTTQGEWLLEEGMGDMSAYAGGEGLWWSTLRHEPTQAVMHVYTDQALYGAEDAIVGADLTHEGEGDPDGPMWELPALEGCFATELVPAIEAWGDGDVETFTPWVAQEQRGEIEAWADADYAGTNARIVQMGSMERYGSNTDDPEYEPSVSATVTYDDDIDRPNSLTMFQLRSDVLSQTTEESLYRVTLAMIGRRFI